MKSALFASALVLLCTSGSAQSVQPSGEQGKTAGVCGETTQENSGDKSVSVSPVQIPISVTDQSGNIVPNLRAADFTIAEDGRPQQICNLTSDDAPSTIGFIFDNSGSTAEHLDWELASVAGFFKFANPKNEYFVIGTSRPPRLIEDFTPFSPQLITALRAVQAGHSTALLDAIYLSIDKMSNARFSRKALIVISDAGDNNSNHSETDVRSALRRSSLQLHFVGLPIGDKQTIEARNGYHELQDLTSDTGGVMIPVGSAKESAQAGASISALLRHQYLLSYRSDNTRLDGKWRKLKVSLSPLPGLPHATIYAPRGYDEPEH